MNRLGRRRVKEAMPFKRWIRVVAWGSATLLLLSAGLDALGEYGSSVPADRSLPTRIVDAFEAAGGKHPGFRRNHAKGLCISGQFDSSGAAAAISTARVLQAGVWPVIGRFSLAGANPSLRDADAQVRGLGLAIGSVPGETWSMALNSIPVFPVRTPEELLERLRAMRPDPGTGHADPALMDAYDDAHPGSRRFRDWVNSHKQSSGYENGDYYSVSTFRFIDAQGKVREARWRLAAETPFRPMADTQSDPDFLSFDLQQRLANGPVRWRLLISLAMPGDPLNDSTRLWPDVPGRTEIDAGTLVIARATTQIAGSCRDVDFNPLMLPKGIAPSDDPLLSARAAAYAESFRRRMHEEHGG
jgi:catalase